MTASSRPRAVMRTLGVALAMLLAAGPAPADGPVPTGGSTRTYLAPNGVPVVDIDTANAAGLSHNRYTQFDVDRRGLVLNNGNASQVVRTSQLAGQVVANLNLRNEASVILNEVVSARRSSLAGYMEVLGGRADVIVANPNGITCAGCGFINTARATLTTGTPDIGAGGGLDGFTVNRGDVLISGDGLDADTTDVLDLVARHLTVKGRVNAKDLKLVAGANEYAYATRLAIAGTGSGDVPSYAIDSSVLGGMYANRIALVATEAGVGVRMLGEAAASADDFRIDAAGRVQIQAQISAQRDLSVTSRAGGADAIDLAGAGLSARNDLVLNATAGGATLAGSVLVAGNDLTGTLGGLQVNGSGTAMSAGRDATLTTQGSGIDLGDASVHADRNLALTAQTDDLRLGTATLSATGRLDLTAQTADLDLGSAAVRAGGDVALSAALGSVILAAGANQGVQSTAGNLSVSAGGDLDNAGILSSDLGGVTLRIANTLTNTGSIHAGTALDLADQTGAAQVTIDNSGTVLADGGLSVLATTLTNTGTVQGSVGTALSVTDLINSGRMVVSNDAAGAATLNLATLTNSTGGFIGGAGDLTLNLSGALTDAGRVQAGGRLSVSGNGGVANVSVANGGELLGASLTMNTVALSVADGGAISADGDLSLTLDSLSVGGSNARIIAASGGSGTGTLVIADRFDNLGAVHSGGDLNLNATELRNDTTGGISALGALTLNASAGDLYNAGALYAGGDLSATSSAVLTNAATNAAPQGSIDAGGAIDLTAATLINNANITAGGDITLTAATFRNEVPGGDTREWYRSAENLNQYLSTNSWYSFPDNYEEAYYQSTWTLSQRYAGGAPAFKPQILGGGTLLLTGFNVGSNLGGVLSAPVVRLVGNGGASFTNDDLALEYQDYKQTWGLYTHYVALGPATYERNTRRNDTTVKTAQGEISNLGAGVYATTIDASGFTLVNQGSPYAAAPSSTGSSGLTAGSLGAIGFAGLNLTLPSNPNGYFVPVRDSDADYLVETNPVFQVGANFVGSDYLAARYGYNPDTVIKRLGDANYEGYLVRQQLLAQTGRNVLAGYADEAAQMQALWDQALTQGARLGLEYGRAPDAAQLAALSEDMVWMVEEEVNGQRVLVPHVYLAQATRDALVGGAAIVGDDIHLALDALENTGGSIQAENRLDIAASGDVINTSGTLGGGDVAVTSSGGSIVNRTLAETTGDGLVQATTVGKTARIEARRDLTLDAAKDITVRGAAVGAGGDATLAAGARVVFDTIEVKDSQTQDEQRDNGVLGRSGSHTTTLTTTNVGATLSTGRNLSVRSGADTTIAGSAVKVGGDLDVDAVGGVNVLARQDRTESQSVSHRSGVGVGGGVFGSETVTTDDFDGRNKGAMLDVAGNTRIKTDADLVVQGSDVNLAGNADLDVRALQVLAGMDEHRNRTTTETVSLLSGATASAGSGTGSGASAGVSGREASAEASVSAEAEAKAGVTLFTQRSETIDTLDRTSRAANFNVGGDLTARVADDVTVQGSNVVVGGDLDIDARAINVLAAENVHQVTSQAEETRFNLSSANNASANAGASAKADGKRFDAKAEASARAKASTDNVIGVAIQKETGNELDITHRGASLSAGGNARLHAREDITAVGSDIAVGGDVDLDARDIHFLAAEDTHLSASHTETTTVGIYVAAEAEAGAQASAEAKVTGVKAGAGAVAAAEAGYGLHVGRDESDVVRGGTTARVSTLRAGGNITRTAEGTLHDVGTQIEAGGDYTQSADRIINDAARNTQFETEHTDSHTIRVGQYGEVGAEAGAEASLGVSAAKAGAHASAKAIAGVRVGYENQASDASSSASQAVVGSIKSGGSLSSTSRQATTLEGTQLAAGGDMALTASSLDYRAAEDTFVSERSSRDIDATVKFGAGVAASAEANATGATDAKFGPQVEASLQLGLGLGESHAASTHAVTGGVQAGGNLKITTTDGDLRLEGTDLAAGGDAELNARGNVAFTAVHDTASSSDQQIDLGVGVSVQGGGGENSGEGSVDFGLARDNAASSVAKVGSLSSGGKLTVNAGGNAGFEGTQIAAGDSASVNAGGSVDFSAAISTARSESLDLDVSASGGGGSGGGEAAMDLGFGYGNSNQLRSRTAAIQGGGGVSVSAGGDVNQTGQVVAADQVQAGGRLNTSEAARVDESIDVGFSAGFGFEAEGKGKAQSDGDAGTRKTGQTIADTDLGSIRPAAGPATGARKTGDESTTSGGQATETGRADGDVQRNADPDGTDDAIRPKVATGPAASTASSPVPITPDQARARGWKGEDGKWLWPPNDGFQGDPQPANLKVGTVLERFGSDYGKFFAPPGTPLEQRAMAPDSKEKPQTVSRFKVLKPLPVQQGEIAPWFDQPGGGTQFKSDLSVNELIEQGYIERIEKKENVRLGDTPP